MNLTQSIVICITKMMSTSGRLKRDEFWGFALFVLLYSLFSNYFFNEYDFIHPASIINTVILSIIHIALSNAITRRLHDIGQSGWSQLIMVTIIGIPILVYWLTHPSEKSDNRYGQYHNDNDTFEYQQKTIDNKEIMPNYNNGFFEAQRQKPLENSMTSLEKTQHTQSFGKRTQYVSKRNP